MNGYWHFTGLAVVVSFLSITTQTHTWMYGFVILIILLYMGKRLPLLVAITTLFILFFFYWHIPTLHRPPPIQKPTITSLTGTITGHIQQTPKKIAFKLKNAKYPANVQIVYFIDEKETVDISQLKNGATCIVKGKLQTPEGARNPGQFDYQHYLLTKGIQYQLTIPTLRQLSCNGSSFLAPISNIRAHLLSRLHSHTSPVTFAWLSALVLGDDSLLPQSTIDLFQRWGLSHILAISGLHVGLVVTLMYFLLIKLNLMTKEKAMWIMLLFLPVYAWMAGGEPSVWRASLMAMLFIILQKLKLSYRVTDVLSIIFLLLVLFAPLMVYQVGFQFTFLVTFGLLLSGKWLQQTRSKFMLILQISFVAQLVILPLQVHYFYTFQPLSILLNGLVVPYFSVFAIPILFLTMLFSFLFPPATTLFDIVFSHIQSLFIGFIQSVDNLFSYPLLMGDISMSIAVIYYILFFTFMICLQKKKTGYAFVYGTLLALFIIMIPLKPYLSPFGTVTMLDIGQGDAIIIELPYRKKVIMIDAGAKVQTGYLTNTNKNKVYKQIIKPYLDSKGIHTIDTIILSHADFDHYGSVKAMTKDVTVHQIMVNSYFDTQKLHLTTQIPIKRMKANQHFLIGEQPFLSLAPTTKQATPNENSLVVYTTMGGKSFLFTGDTDKKMEKQMVEAYPKLLVDVLKVAHHGSKTSSSTAFLAHIQPAYGLISVGRHNMYGHPSKTVVERLQANGARVLRTDQNGAIIFKFKGNTGTFYTYLP